MLKASPLFRRKPESRQRIHREPLDVNGERCMDSGLRRNDGEKGLQRLPSKRKQL
jgi:hypothetical protein